jgi:hypothetical protein
MEALIEQIFQLLGSYIPRLVGALAVLVLGWIVASIIAAIIRNILHRTTLDNRLVNWVGGEKAKTFEVERSISRGVFYLIMLFVLVAFFQVLGITLITEPLNNLLNGLFQYAPKILGAGILIVVAWLVARVMRLLVSRLLGASKLEEQLRNKAGADVEKLPLTKTLSDTVYWLILLLFFPAILSTLGLEGLLRPVQGMVDKILDFLPNIITALLILVIGWIVARIIQRIVASLLEAIGTDTLSEKAGLTTLLGKQKLSGFLGFIVFILVLVPVLVASLNALKLDAIMQPASKMLEMIMTAIPDIFVASIIILVSYAIGRVLAGLVSNVLAGIGFNTLLARLGLGKEVAEGKLTPANIVGYLVLIGIMLFATIEASDQLGFTTFSGLLTQFMLLAGHILLGLIIFAIGLFLANLVSKAILATATVQAKLLALSARLAIVVLAGAMALRQMGLANEIINLAFGLIFGALAVAVAIALGLGGREIAARELEEWVKSIKSKQ